MKKTITLSALLTIFISSFSQITMTSADMPVAGWTQQVAKDTLPLPVINFGNPGANQVYNFSNLVPLFNNTVLYKALTTQQQSVFTGADVAITTDNQSYLFTKTTTGVKFDIRGLEGKFVPSGNVIQAPYQTPADIFHFPTTYGTTFSGSSALVKIVDGSDVDQPVDKVRYTTNSTYTDEIDGWGTITTPVGTYNCLRKKRTETVYTLVEYKTFSFSSWATAPGYPTTVTTTRYSYPTLETKGSVVTFDYDPNTPTTVTGVTYSLIPPAGSANNPPVAVTDTVTLTQGTSSGIIHVANNDTDPDGDNLCMTSVWGSPYVTEYIGGSCDMVIITPDSSFVGTDTAYYSLCDLGTPSLCDTGMIIFTVTANPGLLPVASFIESFIPGVNLFSCSGYIHAYADYTVINTSTNYDSTYWNLKVISQGACNDSVASFWGDTLHFNPDQLWSCNGFSKLEVCMIVSNSFGWAAKCDTICNIGWLGISEISLSNISLYPNPATNHFTIDMRNNNDAITRDYTAIEIYNAIGGKVLLVGENTNKGGSKIVNIPVSELPEGMYVATIVDSKGERRTLGRFTKE